MFESSKDILFIVIAVCVVTLTFFLSWAMYYVVMMLKRAHMMITEVSELVASIKEKIDRVEQLLSTIEEKVKNSASYLPILMKGITELVDFFKKKKEAKTIKKASKK